MSTRVERRVVAKTADYTINPTLDRPGTTFTNRGATGTIIFTLPAPGAGVKGWWYRFKTHADQIIRVATAVADTLVTFNDATADTLSAQTGAGMIGAEMEAFCDGTSWFVSGVAVGHTYTVAT